MEEQTPEPATDPATEGTQVPTMGSVQTMEESLLALQKRVAWIEHQFSLRPVPAGWTPPVSNPPLTTG